MIQINELDYPWQEGMRITDIFPMLGYHLKRPPVLVHINGETVRRKNWDETLIPDGSRIRVVRILRGG